MGSCEDELMIRTFHSILELVRDEPTAIVDDSSFDKIVDSLYEVCTKDRKCLDSVFQSVSRMEEILTQLAINVNSKAAAFGIRLLEICIVFQKVQYQNNASLLKQLLTCDSQPNVLCAVLSVLKAILSHCNGIYWLLEEQMHLLVINHFCTSSFFVARMAEGVIQCVLLNCTKNVIDKSSSHELCARYLDDLVAYLAIDSKSSIVSYAILIRIVSHLITSGLSAEALQYLFTCYWPFDKWFAQFAVRSAEECQLILNLFETCIKNDWTTLLTPLLSDYSIVLGYASGLCEQRMVPVATRLLTLAISLPTTNQITTNKSSFHQLLVYPLTLFLQKDDGNFPTDDHKVIVTSMRQFMLDHTEQALLSALKNVKHIMKALSNDWCIQYLELCINLLAICASYSTDHVQHKLSMSSQHKVITELLVILSDVLEHDQYNCLKINSLPLTRQLAECLVAVVQRRSFSIQVTCKTLCLIGQVLTTLLQPDVGVASDLATSNGRGLLSNIAESLQLCSMDINWEVRDSCVELIGSLANEQISDGMVQFLCSSKLCDLVVTRGLIDVELCVKASAILSLSYILTTPQIAKPFMQQKSDHFSNHLNAAHAILEFTDMSSHDTIVRVNAWRAFSVVCKRNSELLGVLTDRNDILKTLSSHLLEGITDDNWEIKIEVMEILTLIYQFLVIKQSSIPDDMGCCSSQSREVHDSKCHVLESLSFFQVLKEAITDYHAMVRKKGEELVGLLQSTPHNCDCHQCKTSVLEISELYRSNCPVQERSPQEIFLDVLQEIIMAAKCEESELKETDCY